MTDLTADEMFKRIVRSLKENSAELAREQRAEQNARVRQIAIMCLIFVGGIAAGALLITAL
jgi:hypothetical protein